MKYTDSAFLEEFDKVRWETALRTYGNNHSTLIGLLVDWWVTLSRNNFALESGPSSNHMPKGKGRGQCDIMFGEKVEEKDQAVGVAEVEGSIEEKWDRCVKKIDRFFENYKSLQFAILLIYPYQPTGRGKNRQVALIDPRTLVPLVNDLSKKRPSKGIVVIIVSKQFNRDLKGIRARNDYYKCTPTTIKGFLSVNGDRISTKTFRSVS